MVVTVAVVALVMETQVVLAVRAVLDQLQTELLVLRVYLPMVLDGQLVVLVVLPQ
jgi:hypothetical protein